MSRIINTTLLGKKVEAVVVKGIINQKDKNIILDVESTFYLRFGIEFKNLSKQQQMNFIKLYVRDLVVAHAPFADDEFDKDDVGPAYDDIIKLGEMTDEYFKNFSIINIGAFDLFDETDILFHLNPKFIGIPIPMKMSRVDNYRFDYIQFESTNTLIPSPEYNEKEYVPQSLILNINVNKFYKSLDWKEIRKYLKLNISNNVGLNFTSMIFNFDCDRDLIITNDEGFDLSMMILHDRMFEEYFTERFQPTSIEQYMIHLNLMLNCLFSRLKLNYIKSLIKKDYNDIDLEWELLFLTKEFGHNYFKNCKQSFMTECHKMLNEIFKNEQTYNEFIK